MLVADFYSLVRVAKSGLCSHDHSLFMRIDESLLCTLLRQLDMGREQFAKNIDDLRKKWQRRFYILTLNKEGKKVKIVMVCKC